MNPEVKTQIEKLIQIAQDPEKSSHWIHSLYR